MRELAWHLFTWGEGVTIVSPDRLRDAMREALAAAHKAHGQAS
jgi:predicted DNA-binding transcriptional regulator YafY